MVKRYIVPIDRPVQTCTVAGLDIASEDPEESRRVGRNWMPKGEYKRRFDCYVKDIIHELAGTFSDRPGKTKLLEHDI